VKNWQETSDVLARAASLDASGRSSALALVTAIEGSAYRRPGAKFLVDDEGGTLGGVSGGCLEADVREIALACLADGTPRRRRYETGDDEDVVWGLGLGCDGTVDVHVQPITASDPALARARELLEGDARFALATVIEGGTEAGATVAVGPDGKRRGTTGDDGLDAALVERASARTDGKGTGIDEIGDARVFVEVLEPPPRMLLFGAGDDAIPLAAIASSCGFRVSVIDRRPAHLTAERFPGAALVSRRSSDGVGELPVGPDTWAVVMTHAIRRDRAWVAALAGTDVPYIGILGPRARRDEIVEELELEGDDRIYGPVGLDTGADGPEQIATSVVTEVLAVRSGRPPRHLRDRERPIHDERGTGEKVPARVG